MKSNIFKIYEQTTSDDILKNLANFFWFCFVCWVLCGIAIVAICLPFWLMLIAQNSFGAEAFIRAIVFISSLIVEAGLFWTLFNFYVGLKVTSEQGKWKSIEQVEMKYKRNNIETSLTVQVKDDPAYVNRRKTQDFEDIRYPTKQELVLFRTSYPDQIDSNFDYVFKHILK